MHKLLVANISDQQGDTYVIDGHIVAPGQSIEIIGDTTRRGRPETTIVTAEPRQSVAGVGNHVPWRYTVMKDLLADDEPPVAKEETDDKVLGVLERSEPWLRDTLKEILDRLDNLERIELDRAYEKE